MNSYVKASEIADAPICEGLTSECVEALARHLEASYHQHDEVLYREGSLENNDLLIVLQGNIEISTEHAHGSGGMLKIKLEPGDVAGIMGFVGERAHVGTARVVGECRVAHLSRDKFAHMCQKHPSIAIAMLRFLVVALDRFSVMVLERYNDSLSFMHGAKKH